MDEEATIHKTPTTSPILKRHNEDHAIHQTPKPSPDFEEAIIDYNSEDVLYITKSKCSLCSAGKK